jgi:hypothetical protein
VGGV